MNRSNRLRNPLKTARGLGSAKDGTGHWIAQRITAVALKTSGAEEQAMLIEADPDLYYKPP